MTVERRFNLQAWGLFALVLIFGGLLMAMGGKIWDVKWVIFAGLVIMFSGVFGIAAYGVILQTRPRRGRPDAAPLHGPELLRADTTNKLPPIDSDDLIPSAVDHTTEILKTPVERNR